MALELLATLERGGSRWQRTSRVLGRRQQTSSVQSRVGSSSATAEEAYATLARMVRPTVSRYPLVEGEGNWGDGTEPPMEPEFTSCRLSDAGRAVLSGLLPNLLLNGALGDGTLIYVGLPHNAGEVLGAALRIAENEAIDDQALLQEVPGPDLPEGGIVLLSEGARKAEATGEGTVTVQARVRVERTEGGAALVVEELPFGVGFQDLADELCEVMARYASQGKPSPILDVIPGDGGRPWRGDWLTLPLGLGVEPETCLAELVQGTKLSRRLQVRMEVEGTGVSVPDLLRRHVAARFSAHRRLTPKNDAARQLLLHEFETLRSQFSDERRSLLSPEPAPTTALRR